MKEKIFLTLAILLAHTTLSAQTTIQTEFNNQYEPAAYSWDPISFYTWLNQLPPQQVNMLSSANIVNLATFASLYRMGNVDNQINPAVIQNLNPTALSDAITTIATTSTNLNSVYPLALLVSNMSPNQWTPSVVSTFLTSLQNAASVPNLNSFASLQSAANFPYLSKIVTLPFIQDLHTLEQMFTAQGLTSQSSVNSTDYNSIVTNLISNKNNSLASILLNGLSPSPFTAQTVEAILNQGTPPGINLAFIQSLPANVIIEIDNDYRNSGNGFTQFESLLTLKQLTTLGEFPSANSALWNQSTNQWITLLQNENTSPAIVQLIVDHLAADPAGSQFLYMIQQPPGQIYAFNSTMAQAIIPSLSSALIVANINSIPKAYLPIIAPALTPSQVNALLTTSAFLTTSPASYLIEIIQHLSSTQLQSASNDLMNVVLAPYWTNSQIKYLLPLLSTHTLSTDQQAIIQALTPTQVVYMLNNLTTTPAILSSLTTSQIINVLNTGTLNNNLIAAILPNQSDILTQILTATFNIPQWQTIIQSLSTQQLASIFTTPMPTSILSSIATNLTNAQLNDVMANLNAGLANLVPRLTSSQANYLYLQIADIIAANPQALSTNQTEIIQAFTPTQLSYPQQLAITLALNDNSITTTMLATVFTATDIPSSLLTSIASNLTNAQLDGVMTNLDAGLTNLVPRLTNLQANYLSLQITKNPQATLPANQIEIIQAFTPTQLAYLMNQPAGSFSYPYGQFFASQISGGIVWTPNPQAFTTGEAQAIVPYLTITQLMQTLPNINSTALQILIPDLTSAQIVDLFSSNTPLWQTIIQSLSIQQLAPIFTTHMPASMLNSIATNLTNTQLDNIMTNLNVGLSNLVPRLTNLQADYLSLQIANNPQATLPANQIEIIQAFTPTQLSSLAFTTGEAQTILPYLTTTQLIQMMSNVNSTALQILIPNFTSTQLAILFTANDIPSPTLNNIASNLTNTQLNSVMTNLNVGLSNLIPRLTNLQANYLSLQIANNPQATLPANQIKIIQAFTPTQLSYLMNQPAGAFSYPLGQALAWFSSTWNPNPQAFTAEEAQTIVPHLTITQLMQTLSNVNSTAFQTLTPALTSAQVAALFSPSNNTANFLPNIISNLTQSQLTQIEPTLSLQQLATVLALNNSSITITTLATVFTATGIPSSLLNSVASNLTDAQLNNVMTNLNAGLSNLVPHLTNSQANYLFLQITSNSQATLSDNQIKIIQAFTPTQLLYLINQPTQIVTYPYGSAAPWVTQLIPNPQALTAGEAQTIVKYLTVTQLIPTLPNLNSTALQLVTSNLTSTQLSGLFTTKGLSSQLLKSIATLLSPTQKEGMTSDGIKSLNAIVSQEKNVAAPADTPLRQAELPQQSNSFGTEFK